jgi:hypothetical protein
MSLVALAFAWTVTSESPLPMLEIGTLTDFGYVSVLAMDREGHWLAGDQKGKVAPDELARVVAATESTVLTTYEGPDCATTPTLQLLRIRRGEVRFSRECGRVPHASVAHLIKVVESFTIRRENPLLVRLDRWRIGDEDRKEAIILRRSGIWSTDNGVGNTGGKELAELVSLFEDPQLETSPSGYLPNCRGDRIHELELPSRTTVRWIAPCQQPGPHLSAALDRLFALVNVTR